MKFSYRILWVMLLLFIISPTQAQDSTYSVQDHYTKMEVDIPMRDGIKLHTTIYSPKDTSEEYPILMQRTPYSSRPYGAGQFRQKIGPNEFLMKEGYIIVYQDVRGRWMSEGQYDNMRAFIPNKKGDQTDEASDTYDTIEWLINNVENNNGNVGTWGISYPGFYSTYSLLSGHPALKAASPQASISDFFFDDFHHNGAYLLSYWRATALFGYQKTKPVDTAWYQLPDLGTQDQYQFFLDEGPLSNLDEYYKEDNEFWQQLKSHPNYDEFWQSRGITQYMKDIKPAVMIVGGLFDAEDLYGPFHIYDSMEQSGDNFNMIVYGPWSHGDWAREQGRQSVGNVYFGDSINTHFQRDYETVFFDHFLKKKTKDQIRLPEAHIYDTGAREWNDYQQWPPKATKNKTWYLGPDQKLTNTPNTTEVSFVSDPKKPVSYNNEIKMVFTPREYMSGDQRFAARRPDVLVFETDVLQEDMKLVGEIQANLKVATTGTAADWVVKVIDVYPPDAENYEETMPSLKMSNYHMMVRSEVMRGRFRNSFEKPEPFTPNKKTDVNITLQGINHTFQKGHKLQIQVQSTWFPLIDLNPQTYVDNIFEAKKEDFQKQTHTVFGDSSVKFHLLEE
ncbi:MAG: CocE/NonD family hydrolase [Christiangramia sp.]|uniref:CocE/NonD family hydrolase n=1 Tax=Christiangramia sp. TaxID=1931228 RepID=UPI003242291D